MKGFRYASSDQILRVVMDTTPGEESLEIDGWKLTGTAADVRDAFDAINAVVKRLFSVENANAAFMVALQDALNAHDNIDYRLQHKWKDGAGSP